MTETTIETQTPADELRDAAKALRCDHSFPCQPPHGSIARPGDCSKCGVPYDYSEPVTDDARDLAKKLADLFDHMANDLESSEAVEQEHRLDDGRRRKFVHPTVDVQSVGPDFVWTAALKVARSIHGKAA
ncbi:hypothetical protein NE236_41960 [Actinoallomurus purpureus]|uniref:hypothetical protein n=1 Tax=Actinoallomurus purpureus TaxID=478114 RepID=UPI002092CE17|nr:hypothetical protein [Actinoallomurus purpureus]MCO6011537.1 hypothetical protein [Actinoallomurus purpureus]